MKKSIIVLIFMALTACDSFVQPNKHITPPLEIVEVGVCHGGDGLFSGPHECSVKVKWPSGRVEIVNSWASVNMVGNIVYKECWIENGRSRCLSSARDRPADHFANGDGFYIGNK